ncbi:hypothetical protein KSS87_017765 [Heliosperma pusillum]|nr:hypothetical protein KSS87_017765 [Heliosperma pusillum]
MDEKKNNLFDSIRSRFRVKGELSIDVAPYFRCHFCQTSLKLGLRFMFDGLGVFFGRIICKIKFEIVEINNKNMGQNGKDVLY